MPFKYNQEHGARATKLPNASPRCFCSLTYASRAMHAQVDDVGELTPVPLPLVSSSTLSKVIEYMRFHFDNPTENDATSAWDARFIEVEYPIMYDLIIAANYLDIKSLLDLGCKRIASIVRGKTPDEIRAEFNIVNDLTPEEQAQIVKENTWVADN